MEQKYDIFKTHRVYARVSPASVDSRETFVHGPMFIHHQGILSANPESAVGALVFAGDSFADSGDEVSLERVLDHQAEHNRNSEHVRNDKSNPS